MPSYDPRRPLVRFNRSIFTCITLFIMLSVLYMLWLRSDEGRPSLPSFLVSVGSRSPIHSPYWWNADSSPKGDSHVIFLIENYNRYEKMTFSSCWCRITLSGTTYTFHHNLTLELGETQYQCKGNCHPKRSQRHWIQEHRFFSHQVCFRFSGSSIELSQPFLSFYNAPLTWASNSSH